MSAPRILLVDDQRQVIRMLRSSLEFSGQDYTVIDVPSGEEALLELARSPVDVLVTDLRLPGISGLELLGRARQMNPEARAILLTGQPTEEIQYQAEALGVVAFLRKPLATNYFLEAVQRAVELAGSFGSPVEVLEEEKPELGDLLERLRLSLRAQCALLLDLGGDIVVASGDLGELDLRPVLPSLTTTFSAGLTASTLLGSLLPTNIQHVDGDSHQFFLLNIGAFFALLVVAEGRLSEGQLEAIRARGQAAANDMLGALSGMGLGEASPKSVRVRPEKSPGPKPTNAPAAAEETTSSTDPDDAGPANEYWEQAGRARKTPATGEGEIMPYDEARRRGILKDPPG
ncbi:MAG: response regulator [Anaerolineales bacterium]